MSNKDIVLVIDDDRVDREILKNILSKDFYVVDYQDAQEGFDFLARHEQEVKCVVVDVYMPGMDGYGFLKKVNESGLKIPIIVTTSDLGEDTQVKVLADGAWERIFKVKPPVFTAEEKRAWLDKMQDVALGSDAFFPFGDNIERAHKSGVKYIAQPGGSVRDDNVIATCNKYGMAMAFTGIRLFHH